MEAQGNQQLLLQHVRQLADEVKELKMDGPDSLIGNLAHWLGAQLVVAAKTAFSDAQDGNIDLKLLRALNSDVVALWRGEQSSERLKVEREWLDLARANSSANLEKLFSEWAEKPENIAKINGCRLSPEERAERIRAIFGMSLVQTDSLPSEPLNSPDLHAAS